jgi:carbon-monoxide dehydrogenase small subunit
MTEDALSQQTAYATARTFCMRAGFAAGRSGIVRTDSASLLRRAISAVDLFFAGKCSKVMSARRIFLAMHDTVDVRLTINGCDYAIRVEPRRTLVDAIREDCGQTGTHIGCEHGICGSCTVIVEDEAVRACLMFAVQADGKKIRTVEGLANGDDLHPLQAAFIEHHGLQCGFCTPGFLMLAVNVLERQPDIGDEELLDVLSSNLCRCTGYHNIVKAVRSAAAAMRGG